MQFARFDSLDHYTPAPGSPDYINAWVAFDFGDGGRYPDGELRPGFANYALAKYLKDNATSASFDTRKGQAVFSPKTHIFAQTLVAQELRRICPGIDESELFVEVGTPPEDGSYVDSWRVANEARENTPWARIGNPVLTEQQERRREASLPRGRVNVVAVGPHKKRATWQTQQAYWTSAEVKEAENLPDVFADLNSTQKWTTRAFAIPLEANPKTFLKRFFTESWWPREMVTRALCRINGGEPSVDNIKASFGLVASWAKRKILGKRAVA